MSVKRDEVALLEELNFNAWPALRTAHYDGWLLRCTGGESRRVNSVNPWTAGALPLEQKIVAAEAIYRRWGRETVFRLTPLADPGLDEALERRGYIVEAPTFVQTASIEPCPTGAVRFFDRAERAWLDAAIVLRGLSGDAADVFIAQHQAVGVEAGWALIVDSGEQPFAVGVVAIERGWAGLHGIYVASGARRRRLGLQISQALVGFAATKGARRAWLQVEQRNTPALTLYAGLGFRTLYSYHHRVRSA